METKKKLTNLQILDLAYEEAIFEVTFDLPLSRNYKIKVKLESVEVPEIWREQRIIEAKLLRQWKEAGADKESIDQDLFEQTIARMDVKDQVEARKNPPANKAIQMAASEANMRAIVEMVPKRLKDAETGEFIFKTPKALEKIMKLIWTDTSLVTLIATKFREVSQKVEETKEEVKN